MSKKLKGHKKGCKCVGCSADTRRRGMAKLGLLKKVRRANRTPKAARANPKGKPYDMIYCAKCLQFHAPPAHKGTHKAYKRSLAATLDRKRRASVHKVMRKAAKRGGHKYRPAKRLKNSPLKFIGSNVRLITNRGSFNVGGKVYGGPGAYAVTVACSHGKGHAVPLGSLVRRMEYDNRPKALRAYGKAGRFYHNFSASVRVASVDIKKARTFTLKSSVPLWRAS